MARDETMSLFGLADEDPQAAGPDAPLAERMRPRTLDEFVGQEHLVGEGRLVRRLIDAGGPLPSLILWGGPGTGKTTLARVLARLASARFAPLSAVLSGVKELRETIALARKERKRGARTVLFIDEIHRYNKAQQDALLQAVEDGTITLIGATTENPSFEVISALLSRTKVLTLQPLSAADITLILRRALVDDERGLASLRPEIEEAEIDRLAMASAGDGGVALTALDSAVQATTASADGIRRVDGEMLVEALGRGSVRVRQAGRRPFQPDLGVDQKRAELGRERLTLLAGQVDRRRCRPLVHRPPPLHPRLRGCGPGRPTGHGSVRGRGSDCSSHRDARGPLPAFTGDHLPGKRTQVERRHASLFGRRRGRCGDGP